MSAMEIAGWVIFAAAVVVLVTWAAARERSDRRLTREYRMGLRAEVIHHHGIQDEVQS